MTLEIARRCIGGVWRTGAAAEDGGGGGGSPALSWRNIATVTFEDTPVDGTVVELTTLAIGAWLADVYIDTTAAWSSLGGHPRFSACGWDLDGNVGGPFYLHKQMAFNVGSWAGLESPTDNQFITGNSVSQFGQGLNSLAAVAVFLGTNIAASPNSSAPPVSLQSYLPGRILDDSLPLQIKFADDGPVVYTTGSADVWILAQDPPS